MYHLKPFDLFNNILSMFVTCMYSYDCVISGATVPTPGGWVCIQDNILNYLLALSVNHNFQVSPKIKFLPYQPTKRRGIMNLIILISAYYQSETQNSVSKHGCFKLSTNNKRLLQEFSPPSFDI